MDQMGGESGRANTVRNSDFDTAGQQIVNAQPIAK